MSILGAIAVPHPPLIIPQVGRGQEKQIEQTTIAYQKAARFVLDKQPDTVVVITPHTALYRDYVHISPGPAARGDLRRFGAGDVQLEVTYDQELVRRLSIQAAEEGFPAGTEGERDAALDHATLIPLWFLREAAGGELPFRVVRMGQSGLDAATHYRLGMMVRDAAQALGRGLCVVASGDLSHYLRQDGPYGLRPEGADYDARVMDILGRAAFDELLAMPQALCERAGECGQRSFLNLAGCLDGLAVRAQALSYQGVTGVGYGVCLFDPAGEDGRRRFLQAQEAADDQARSAPVQLAVDAYEHYVRTGNRIRPPQGLPDWLLAQRAGAFVTLHRNGELRGCIGTIAPTQPSLAEEIIANAISAATRDPRFPRVREGELSDITCSVDVLEAPEDIESEAALDPQRYGVIVSSGQRKGLLLPMLEGIDTVEMQVGIARDKAGIRPGEAVRLQRFRVTRYH